MKWTRPPALARFGTLVALGIGTFEAHLGCEAPGELASPCSADGDCDDSNPCTKDRCATGRRCEFVPDNAFEVAQIRGNCRHEGCFDGRYVELLDVDDFDDANACTVDACEDALPVHYVTTDGLPCEFVAGEPGSCVGGNCKPSATGSGGAGGGAPSCGAADCPCTEQETCDLENFCELGKQRCVAKKESLSPCTDAFECKSSVCEPNSACTLFAMSPLCCK
ncbi:MAG: hypothetical protein FJ096_06930 [Deltaproteobacteria bacterium]|nr:hypothetical protein [Deltaproteobacteria bacterium]